MNPALLEKKLHRSQAKVAVLEKMIEDKTRELYLANAEIHASHQNLESLIRTMPCALLVLDQNQAIEDVNAYALMLLNYQREELLALPATTIFGDHQEGGTIEDGECEWIGKDGIGLPVWVTTCGAQEPVKGENRLVCIALDMREKKQLEVELRHSQKLEAVGQLAAGIAHEINTPLQFIGDNVHFLRDALSDITELLNLYKDLSQDHNAEQIEEIEEMEEEIELPYLEENVPEALERTLSGIERIASIVSAMKAFSHPGEGNKTLVDINDGLTNTLLVAQNEYKYIADVSTELGELPPVLGMAGDLNQVFLNLIVNASHAIADVVGDSGSKGRIAVRTYTEEGLAVIAITDSGQGIPEAIQERVFEPFFTTKEVGQGTGQGLAIAHSIIADKHKGTLHFDTIAGQGTTFYIKLPTARSEDS